MLRRHCGVSFGGSSIAENTVYINGLNVTDFYNRVGFSTAPYRVLQGIPGQDRRLLGRVRPHHRRRHQRGDALGHQRIRVRHRGDLGAELPAVRASAITSTATAARYIIGSHDEYDATNASCTPLARSSRTSCSSSLCTRRATTSRTTPTTTGTLLRGEVRQRVLGREDRLADQRQAPARVAGVLRQERRSRATASTSTFRAGRARLVRQHALHRQRRPELVG